jgi:hypothetical protein
MPLGHHKQRRIQSAASLMKKRLAVRRLPVGEPVRHQRKPHKSAHGALLPGEKSPLSGSKSRELDREAVSSRHVNHDDGVRKRRNHLKYPQRLVNALELNSLFGTLQK